MTELQQKQWSFLIIALTCFALLGFIAYRLRTPEYRVINWLNALPEFTSSSNGFPNANIVDRTGLFGLILGRKNSDFDFGNWNRSGSSIPDVHKILIGLITSQEPRVDPADIIIAIEFIGPEQFVPQLLKALHSPNEQIRDRAIHALFTSKDSQAIEPLLYIADSDPNPAIQANTILLLSQWNSQMIEERLQPIIQAAMGQKIEVLQKCAILATRNIQKRKGDTFGL